MSLDVDEVSDEDEIDELTGFRPILTSRARILASIEYSVMIQIRNDGGD